ncbi:hypothetical protein, partial [Herbaspirillum aquaticum]|uniref:hypothetical protein n=1 Tax=Herbaspirillum aquaticum TaxID=568783 RepID=UPI0024DE358E
VATDSQFSVKKLALTVYLAGAAASLCRGVGYGFKEGLFNANHASIERVKKFLQDFLEEIITDQAA